MPDEEGTVVNSEVVTDTTATGATTEETNQSEASESLPVEDDSTEETEESSDTDSGEEDVQDDSDDTDSEDKPKKGADARKEQLNKEIRDLVAEKNELLAERNQIRQSVEAANADAYKPASVDELLETVNPDTGDYYNRLEAQLEAMRQEQEVERYNNRVADAQIGIQYEAKRALDEFPMFDKDSPDYNAEVASEVDKVLEGILEIDPKTKQVVGSRLSVYQLYKSFAAAAKANAVKAETKAQKNVESMLKNADPTTGGKGQTKSFESMSLSEQEAYLKRKGYDI